MGRQRQPEIRERLLDGCTRYLLGHGLPVTSLRPMADAVGTGPRMLIYHFGTKERLVKEALIEARRRQRVLFDAALRHRPGQEYADTLAEAWSILAGAEGRQYTRLFSTVHNAAPADGPWKQFPAMAVHDWLPTIEDGLRADGYPHPHALATLALAVARGLLLDERATGEYDRAGEAYREFIGMLKRHGAGPPTVGTTSGKLSSHGVSETTTSGTL